jgi:hypothetical protein
MIREDRDNDDLLFDRLVDGELSPDERRRLIASLDDRADGWRRCALAFLEAQTWRGAMRQIAADPAPITTAAAPSAARPITTAAVAVPSPATARRRSARAGTWAAIAAALLAAFGLGWQARRPGAPPEAQLAVAEPRTPQLAGGPADGVAADRAPLDRAPAPRDDAITLVVRSRDGAPQRVEVPLVDGSRLGEQFAASPQWADAVVRDQFEKQGLDLQARRRYAPLFFEQQDRIVPMIVPVDDATIVPVSRPIY